MIIAQIATIPERKRTFEIAYGSLSWQVDKIRFYPNSPTDGWKFKGLNETDLDDTILICDDDIKYPVNFAQAMKAALSIYEGMTGKPCIVTCMGKNLKARPIESFYGDEVECFKTFEENSTHRLVEIPGTCAMAFKRSTCPDLDETFFPSINSDIWMGIYCKQRSIPCYVIPHRANWLTNLMPLLPADTPSVFDRFKDNDKHMTDAVNKYL
jgi:hypothetical protein